MQINAVTSSSHTAPQGSDVMAKVKQAFQNLGTALDSGNLSDAKKALAQLQKNAPAQAGKADDPIRAKLETLSKAVDEGDLKSAQDAYADIKKTVSERPAASSAPAHGSGGPPPGGTPPSGGKKSSSTSDSSSSSKVYDKKDTNKDGTVSWKEEHDYDLKHPEEVKQTATTTEVDITTEVIDALA